MSWLFAVGQGAALKIYNSVVAIDTTGAVRATYVGGRLAWDRDAPRRD